MKIILNSDRTNSLPRTTIETARAREGWLTENADRKTDGRPSRTRVGATMTSSASRLWTVMSTAVMNRLAWLRNTELATRSDGWLMFRKSAKTDCASGSSSKMRRKTRTPRFALWLLRPPPSLATCWCCWCWYCSCDQVFLISRFSSSVNTSSGSPVVELIGVGIGDWLAAMGALHWTPGRLLNCACWEATFPIVREQRRITRPDVNYWFRYNEVLIHQSFVYDFKDFLWFWNL